MEIKIFNLGPYQTNCYLLHGEETAVVIDPAEGEEVLDYLTKNKLRLTHILNTHGHGDHTGGDFFLKENTKALVAIHTKDQFFLGDNSINKYLHPSFKPVVPDILLSDNSILTFTFDSLLFDVKVIHTPGHTPGSVCFSSPLGLFSGDTLFKRAIGRYDFPYSSVDDMRNSIKLLINSIPPDTLIYPGHGPKTIFIEEKNLLTVISNEL
ncbi:MAG: Hydroxyacylglutathione hydrolase GloC [candidate division WS2 bacterium]|uniref:Hydroxyacylglutathione hydrolase GloC n=1 Tax=Psychracetigena formicireducens TaxID=2986056 RepID=A0A9E2F6X5_PSYF1|nr:Hydroxyacylglutathione hydrolase GloC [Candidatus Psychracetigena formicireducens]MBT9145018.1 Hydroxyacylglutathione hydrolase GloC [Candidatus Psychracetigena formicireducens]MBT9150355.1 Hydroxyacylglutathione hydrolase GloC [Candidatus Psychracetigena formicireducens]